MEHSLGVPIKKEKIRIIRTPYVFPEKHVSSITVVPDIGTAYINGTLKSHGYDCAIIDAAGEGLDSRLKIEGLPLSIAGLSADEIVARIPEDVDYIGIQSMHSNRWIYDGFVIKKILEKFPDVKIFMGGEHVTATSDKILRQIPEIGACVLGEGEETVIELLECFRDGGDLSKVEGIAYSENGIVKENGRRQRRKAVSDIALPSWDGVPIAKYLANHCGVNSLSKKAIPIIATRGCPYSCTFCTVPNMWDSKWFARPADDVVKEIESYVKDFGIEHIDFVDLTLVINKKWMTEFAEKLIEANLGITWAIPIGTRTESIDSDLLKVMRRSGLSRVLYSAESGSEATLLRIKKCLTLEKFEKVVKETSDLGICVKIAFIFGFPGQTKKEVMDSFFLINRLAYLGANDIVCLSFIPYPKTELFDQLGVDYDYTDPNKNIRLNNDIPNMQSWSEHFGDTALKFFVVFFTLYFYLLQGIFRPMRVVNGFKRVFIKKLPLTNFESIVFNYLNKKNLKARVVSIR